MNLAGGARKDETRDKELPLFTEFTYVSREDARGDLDDPHPNNALLLETTTGSCHQLADRFRRNKDSTCGNFNYKGMQTGHTNSAFTLEEKDKFYTILEENRRLRAVNQDTTESNRRWQMLNEQRDAYIQKLISSVKDLQKQLDGKYSPSAPSSPSGDFEVLKQVNFKLVDESRHKNHEIDELRKKNVHLTKQLANVKTNHSEHVEVLEMQVRAHRDDWEAERQEKVETQHREAQLMEELQTAKNSIRELQEQLRQKNACRCACHNLSKSNCYSEPILHNPPYYITAQTSTQLISRGPSRSREVHFGNEIFPDGPVIDEHNAILSAPTPPASPADVVASPITGINENNTLQCPNCKKVFTDQLHVQFLDHFERCQQKSSIHLL